MSITEYVHEQRHCTQSNHQHKQHKRHKALYRPDFKRIQRAIQEFYPQKYSNETELYHKLVNIEKLFLTREDHNDVICVWKKELGILEEKGKSLLNIRTETVSAYLHKNRFQVNNLNKERNYTACYLNAHVFLSIKTV